MDVIDLSSGDGWFTLKIAQVARHVSSMDTDAKLLDMARIRLAESGATNCDFVTGDAYDLAALVPTKADFVFFANAFHGVPDGTRLARSARDTLVPGCQFAIVNWHARPREETTILGEPRGPAIELRLTPQQTINSFALSNCRSITTALFFPSAVKLGDCEIQLRPLGIKTGHDPL